MRRAAIVLLAAGLAVPSLACSDDDASPASTTRADEPTATSEVAEEDAATGIPPEVAEHEDDWPTAGQDFDNTRAAAASTISAANVDELDEAWRAELPEAGALSTAPLVLGDVVYLQGGSGQVVAIDRATGEVRWSSEPTGLNIGPFGIAVGHGRVYAMDGSTGVLALEDGGEEVWATDITATDTTGTDIQPVVAGNTVIASSVPVTIGGIYTPGDRGVISALDADTGEVRWTFDTVKGDLWGHPEVNSGGGAWYPPVIDLERGLVYVGVANPAPFPGTAEFPNGSSRPGDNLYTDSVVALDLETGELAWFHQVNPHDLFDRDQVHTLMADLADGTEVLVSAGKSGTVVGLDPDDGTVLWEAEVGEHENDDLTELDGPTTILPGTYGGVLTPPATADGTVYLAAVNAPQELVPDAPDYFGATLGTRDGDVAAVDAASGEVLWSTPVPGDPLGGTTVVNDLVFTALLDGTILALRRDDGESVWTYDAGGGINGWMAAVDGELFVPIGNAAPPQVLALGLP